MKMKTNKGIRAVPAALLAAVILFQAFALAGCSPPPDIEDIRPELEALVAASAEINEIFFGRGLPVYDRDTSSGDMAAEYDEKSGVYYWFIKEDGKPDVLKYYTRDDKTYRYASEIDPPSLPPGLYGILVFEKFDGDPNTLPLLSLEGEPGSVRFFDLLDSYEEPDIEIVYDEDSPVHYDYVRLDCPYQTVDQIKEAAEKVYSADYLEGVYTMMFDGYMVDDQVIYARYMSDESGKTDYFLKSNRFEPYFETQTTYDLTDMKIVRPSRGSFINVEVTAYGTYIDYENLEKKTGNFKKVLKFVLGEDGWRLDSPTY